MPKTRNDRKALRRKEAEARQAHWAGLTMEDQIALLWAVMKIVSEFDVAGWTDQETCKTCGTTFEFDVNDLGVDIDWP